jgi:putative cardiolipin synthase
LAALIRKKQENPNIKIEILLDNWGSEGFSAALAAELIKLGIDVKFYNISSPLLFTRHNQRNHRKLFLIDAGQSDGFALMGGVNTAAEHLGMHPSISKVDREILIQGPSLLKMQNNFRLFWEHPWSERKKVAENIVSAESLTAKILRENPQPSLAESSVTKNNWISVPGLKFVSDAPGGSRANNRLQKDFQRQLGLTKQQLLIENGYFIPPQELREQFEKILQSGGRIEVLTDSPLSTSSYDVKKMALSYPHQRWLVGRGGEVSGSREPGIHSKTLVQDQGNVFISSYNLDARSQNWNQELGIWFFGAEELAKLTALNMRNRKDEIGLRLDAQGKYGGLDLYEEFRSRNAGEERLTRWTRWLIEPFY